MHGSFRDRRLPPEHSASDEGSLLLPRAVRRDAAWPRWRIPRDDDECVFPQPSRISPDPPAPSSQQAGYGALSPICECPPIPSPNQSAINPKSSAKEPLQLYFIILFSLGLLGCEGTGCCRCLAALPCIIFCVVGWLTDSMCWELVFLHGICNDRRSSRDIRNDLSLYYCVFKAAHPYSLRLSPQLYGCQAQDAIFAMEHANPFVSEGEDQLLIRDFGRLVTLATSINGNGASLRHTSYACD